jgi:hypothetical protein
MAAAYVAFCTKADRCYLFQAVLDERLAAGTYLHFDLVIKTH